MTGAMQLPIEDCHDCGRAAADKEEEDASPASALAACTSDAGCRAAAARVPHRSPTPTTSLPLHPLASTALRPSPYHTFTTKCLLYITVRLSHRAAAQILQKSSLTASSAVKKRPRRPALS